MSTATAWRVGRELAGRYKRRLAAYFAVLVLATGFEGFGLGLLLPIVQTMGDGGEPNIFSTYATRLFALVGIDFTFTNLIVVFSLASLAKFVLLALSLHLMRSLSATIAYDLRRGAYQNLMDLPISYFYQVRTGDLVATQYTSAQNAAAVFESAAGVASGLFFCVLYLTLNALISWPLTLMVGALASLSYYFVLPRFRVGFIKGSEEKEVMDAVNSHLFDTLSGIKTIKTFDNAALHLGQFQRKIKRFRELSVEIMDNRIVAQFFYEPFIFLLAVLCLYVAVEYLSMPFATVGVFLVIFIQTLPKLKAVNAHWIAVHEFLPHLLKVQDLVDREGKTYLPSGTTPVETLERDIRFESVSFRYGRRDENALSDIDALIEKGSTVAVVGPSGGGKTTFVDLLLRLHDPTEGTIRMDGVTLSDIRPGDWRRLIGVVEQAPHLFHDTVASNIRYGKPDATDEEVVLAAKMAYAHEFIKELPQGYESVVGDRGQTLSGGQKQRVALARALVRAPQLLVLDEATSSLDSEFERLIQAAIQTLRGGITIVVVAHRLSTVRDADKILVIDGGRIIETGTHDELMSRPGRYQELVTLQGGAETERQP